MTYRFIKKSLPAGRQGFTLIETLVAVLLLATSIAGPLTIASKGLNSALVAKDQITAYFLAQDAVEYIRYKRDTACLAAGAPCTTDPTAWLATVSNCISADGSKKCTLDSTNNNPATPTVCPVAGCVPIRYDSTNNRFTYAGGGGTVTTLFTRTVSIINPYGGSTSCTPAGKCEAMVVVTVSWNDTGVARSVVVRESIFNWQ